MHKYMSISLDTVVVHIRNHIISQSRVSLIPEFESHQHDSCYYRLLVSMSGKRSVSTWSEM